MFILQYANMLPTMEDTLLTFLEFFLQWIIFCPALIDPKLAALKFLKSTEVTVKMTMTPSFSWHSKGKLLFDTKLQSCKPKSVPLDMTLFYTSGTIRRIKSSRNIFTHYCETQSPLINKKKFDTFSILRMYHKNNS